MLINEKINKIKEDFSFFDNWEDKYQYLIDLGKKLPDLEDFYKTEEYRVQGCTSNLWMVSEINDGKIRDKILENSPKKNEEFFVVPKVIE